MGKGRLKKFFKRVAQSDFMQALKGVTKEVVTDVAVNYVGEKLDSFLGTDVIERSKTGYAARITE
jgi:hypothetical protein